MPYGIIMVSRSFVLGVVNTRSLPGCSHKGTVTHETCLNVSSLKLWALWYTAEWFTGFTGFPLLGGCAVVL